jgi:hypothetical protein
VNGPAVLIIPSIDTDVFDAASVYIAMPAVLLLVMVAVAARTIVPLPSIKIGLVGPPQEIESLSKIEPVPVVVIMESVCEAAVELASVMMPPSVKDWPVTIRFPPPVLISALVVTPPAPVAFSKTGPPVVVMFRQR